MSQAWDGLVADLQRSATVDFLKEWYDYLALSVLVGFMFYMRAYTWDRFVKPGGVIFSGNDAWYHYRMVSYTVRHWPSTMPYEVFTYFPHGTASGQFGTLYDQTVATVALIVGLGSPSQQTIGMVLLFAPAVIGTLVALPVFYIGRRMGGRPGALVAVLVLALSAGSFFQRTLVGFADHHAIEALFHSLGILGVMVAVSAAESEKPVFEVVAERDMSVLRKPLGWAAVAGVALTLYLLVWPPAILLIGILAVYLTIQMSIEVLQGDSPEPTAFAGAVTMLVTGLTILPALQFASIRINDYSLLQPLLAFAVAAGCVFMAWLAREWDDRSLPLYQYPLTVVSIQVVLALGMWLLTPDLFNLFANQVLRVIGFTTSPTAGTVGEAQPLQSAGVLFESYGFAVFLALGGGAIVLARLAWDEDVPSEHLLVVIWAIFMTAATFTQARFQYYLVMPVAILSGYTVSLVVDAMVDEGGLEDLESYQVFSLAAIALLVVVPMVAINPTVALFADFNGPGQGPQGWNDAMGWMQGNTPVEGNWNDTGEQMHYYGRYPIQNDYNYSSGAYGVMSWWDYGHWITVMSKRIPNANPFQQGARPAANFLLAPNESQANDVLRSIDEEDARTRYVAVDWKMVNTYTSPIVQNRQRSINGKFFAPVQFYETSNVSGGDYWGTLYFEQSTNRGPLLYSMTYRKQAYYESMVTRLYRFHGSAVEPRPVVIDWDVRQSRSVGQSLPMTWSGSPSPAVRIFANMSAAREFVRNDTTARIGGFGGNPRERVQALEHYRYVASSSRDAAARSRGYQLSQTLTYNGLYINRTAASPLIQDTSSAWTKIFERVPGATIEGEGPPNTLVRASVEMAMPNSNGTFNYTQRARTDANGDFTMTVPYSTTGYDEWGPENGHTNVSVRAVDGYQFVSRSFSEQGLSYWSATIEVPEANVIGEDDDPVEVTLEETTPTQVNATTGAGRAPATP